MSKKAWQLKHTTRDEDPTRQFLANLFWRAGTPLVASLLLQACANDDPGLTGSDQQLTGGSMNCDAFGVWRPMSALKLSQQVDFAALRSRAAFAHPVVNQRDAAGVPCARSSDPRLCEAEMRRASLIEAAPEHAHLLIVQGDTVRALQTLEEKITLLGTIDTPDEALLLVDHLGLPIGCGREQRDEATQVSLRDAGYRVVTRTPDLCGNARTSYTVDVDDDGKVNIVAQKAIATSSCAIGRRPPNLLAHERRSERALPLARYFARAARLEGASVDAFDQLAEELRILGAPRALRDAARSAAEDEVRHARDTSALAEHFGARAELPRLSRRRLRTGAEVALDNAIEGCVYETYSAYLATVQARMVSHTALAVPLAAIAEDETGHAALAWQISAWLEPKLDPHVRRRIDQMRRRALAGLGARAA